METIQTLLRVSHKAGLHASKGLDLTASGTSNVTSDAQRYWLTDHD
jgi:hypothetical protein